MNTPSKIIVLFLGTLIFPFFTYSEGIIFPPELKWWIDEVQKVNSDISNEKFIFEYSREINFVKGKYNEGQLYPVFARWNYSGNYVAYFNVGSQPVKSEGKYKLLADVDSSVYIIDKGSKSYMIDSYGSSSGINAINWIRDNLLVGVGTEVNNSSNKIDLIINMYFLENGKVRIKKYTYKNAFSSDRISELKLNWYEQRPDYFEIN